MHKVLAGHSNDIAAVGNSYYSIFYHAGSCGTRRVRCARSLNNGGAYAVNVVNSANNGGPGHKGASITYSGDGGSSTKVYAAYHNEGYCYSGSKFLFFTRSLDNGATWDTPYVLDSSTSDIGEKVSITAYGDNVYASYFDDTNNKLRFAYNDHSGDSLYWNKMFVNDGSGDETTTYLCKTSIEVSDNYIYIAYKTYSGGNIKVARTEVSNPGANWVINTIVTNGSFSLGIDAVGSNVYLVYIAGGNLYFTRSEDYGVTW